MAPAAELLGYASKVHKSLVSEDRLAGVQYMSALANGFLWLIIAITFQRVRAVLVGVVLHLAIAILTKGDIHRLTNLMWYVLYRAFYGRS